MMWYHFTNLSLHCVSRNVFSLEFNKAPHSSILSMDIFFICASRFFDSMSLQLYRPLLSFHLAYAQATKALLDPSLKMINVGCSLAASFGFTHLLNLLFFIYMSVHTSHPTKLRKLNHSIGKQQFSQQSQQLIERQCVIRF